MAALLNRFSHQPAQKKGRGDSGHNGDDGQRDRQLIRCEPGIASHELDTPALNSGE